MMAYCCHISDIKKYPRTDRGYMNLAAIFRLSIGDTRGFAD